jgi:hypothetical protein
MSPANDAVKPCVELFERGFRPYGGLLNREWHLSRMSRQTGFDVIDFSARLNHVASPEEARGSMAVDSAWLENLPFFEEAVALGWVDRAALERMGDSMRQ